MSPALPSVGRTGSSSSEYHLRLLQHTTAGQVFCRSQSDNLIQDCIKYSQCSICKKSLTGTVNFREKSTVIKIENQLLIFWIICSVNSYHNLPKKILTERQIKYYAIPIPVIKMYIKSGSQCSPPIPITLCSHDKKKPPSNCH